MSDEQKVTVENEFVKVHIINDKVFILAKKAPITIESNKYGKEILNNPIFYDCICDLEFTVRVHKQLLSNDIQYIGELVQLNESDLLTIPNFGKKCLDEVKETLNKNNLKLGTYINNWERPSKFRSSKGHKYN